MAEELYGFDASPVDVARGLHLAGVAGLVLFDSGRATGARWSILACEPTKVLTEREGRFVELPGEREVDDPVEWLTLGAGASCPRSRVLEALAPKRGQDALAPKSLPFHGGLAGLLGFEFAWQLDDIHAPRKPAPTPDLWVGDYPCALVYSHAEGRWWLTGDADSPAADKLREAVRRPQTATPSTAEGARFRLTITADEYAARVQRAIDAIYAGELFEVNYTERFCADWRGDGFALFDALRQTSSGAYGAYLDAGDFQLASVSPEQFLAVRDGHVITRPIKGTRRRGDTPEEDASLAEDLVTSAKDRAENVMIVDLMRNDLTRVCKLGSVEATEVCGLYSFEGVHHLISTVEGDLEEGLSSMDALLASFPPGSITGAPKLRSIELIAELEETARGPYTGTLFFASADGTLDSSVLIRTAVLCDETVWYGAGGAVVADSDPMGEYEEACVKARPLQTVVEGEGDDAE
ncbi:anthranilate synthase component I family protein [Persicimonas caeni]|uniref:Anthranilate synthase component I family protein n=1 Tax=Persicimonas caeni TaxID=2292766 RepID=A0A4Y6Q207_PERCE|nr:anthranilate synthase component I family protein [Persicimonas caeni]QDG54583.1 anthranilate synthase component I family protein [Persicimonas caeni]QED35804.1 anthranilate synthase component I family protein [Persicimonas caeni]